MNKALLMVLGLVIVIDIRTQAPVIERYQPERDYNAVVKIIDDHPHYLRYEVMGYPAGTTEKYLDSTKYFTDVLRIDGKTIGFINYVAFDRTLLTFNFGRYGLIHLMGVDKEYQHRGYGTLLLRHAVTKLKELNTPTIILSVKRDNVNAFSLYEKEGFSSNFPIHMQVHMPDLFLTLKVDVPTDKLPKGNFIQQHPKIVLALSAVTVGCLLYLKLKK